MSIELYNRAHFLVMLPIAFSNFLTLIIMRWRLQRTFGLKLFKGVDRILITYVIMFGLLAALLPEQIYFSMKDHKNYKLNFRIV